MVTVPTTIMHQNMVHTGGRTLVITSKANLNDNMLQTVGQSVVIAPSAISN